MNMPVERKYKTRNESITLGFDFSSFGQVIGGETLSNPEVSFIGSPAGAPDIGPPEVNTLKFRDAKGGFDIPAGKGVIARFTGGTPGEYDVLCRVQTSGSDYPEIVGKLIVTEE